MAKSRIERNIPAGFKQAYFPTKLVVLERDWNAVRTLGQKTLSPEALLKLEWIIFYHTLGKKNVSATALHFGTTRKTLHKWLKRFKKQDLLGLEENPRTPVTKRHWEVTPQEEKNIILLRRKNMEYGKKKLKVLYKREYGKTISTWKIECVIRSRRLYPDPKRHKKHYQKGIKSKQKVRIHEVKDAIGKVEEFGFLWHIDAIIIWWYGRRRIIFTALEDKTKIAYARVYKTNTSGFAKDFLTRLSYLVEGKVEIMHSDNGSELSNIKLKCT